MGREGGPVRGALRDEAGAAMIEAALVIPVVLLLAFGVVTVGRVVHAEIAVQSVVREAGRALATAPSASAGIASARDRARAVAEGNGLSADRLELTIDPGAFERGGTVSAEARYAVSLGDLPLLGHVAVTVSSRHDERVELYRSREVAAP